MRSTLIHPWMIHPRTGAPLEAVGVRKNGRPIWPIMGAAEDDEDDAGGDEDDAGGDDEDAGGDDEDDVDEGKSPEDLKAELARLRRSQAKLLKEARNRTKTAPPKVKAGDKDGDDKNAFTKDDIESTREETRESVRAEMLPAVIRPAARTVLEGLGMAFPKDVDVARAKLTRALKLADIEDVELDEDGELVGLDTALREVRRQFPEMFKGARVRTPGNAGGGGKRTTKPRSATEQQMAAAFGKDLDDD